METRPKIILHLLPFDKKVQMACKIFLAIIWCLTIYSLLTLPIIIPVHFNANGQADSYGNKMTLLILPVLATAIYVGLDRLCAYPHIFNYLAKITADNAERQYSIATRMLRFMMLSILLIFLLIILFTHLTTIGVTKGLGDWFLPLAVTLLLVPAISSITESLKERK